jgi:hypothetical protein
MRRPHFQRAFVEWLKFNASRFLVSVRISCVNSQGVALCFPDHPPYLAVWLDQAGLNVSVEWQGECKDLLLSLDAVPQFEHGIYRCSLCVDADQSWPTLAALWCDHLYEPFLSWVNGELATARKLRIYEIEGGSTWAELTKSQTQASESGGVVAEIQLGTVATALDIPGVPTSGPRCQTLPQKLGKPLS